MPIARVNVNVDPDQRDALVKIAKEMRQSVSSLVRHLIDRGLRDPRFFLPEVPSGTMQTHSHTHHSAHEKGGEQK